MLAEALCLILGDSNAVKIAPFRPACENVSVNGIDSDAIRAMAPPDRGYRMVIVSMGSNDRSLALAGNLRAIRGRYRSARFVWIAAVKPNVAKTVTDFARNHRDTVIALAEYPNHGGHPLHPEDVARALPE